MKRVDIIYFEASSGHKSAAEALRFALQQQNPSWIVRSVDMGDILKCQTWLMDIIYHGGVRYFNWCMKRERYFFFTQCIRVWVAYTRLVTGTPFLHFLQRWTSSFWKDCPPDAVISVTPMKHTIVYESARCVNPDVVCITIPVDYSEMTSGYWFQSKIKQHYLLGTVDLEQEALESGVSPSEIRLLGGMVIDQRFYDDSPFDRSQYLSDLGLDPSLPMGVISFGGQGTVNVLRCARRIAETKLPVNLICLCGRNAGLLKKVENLKTPYPLVALGFTEAPPVDAHRAATFLVGKPGTMTLNEALITDTAFIFIKATGLKALQGENEAWVLKNGFGVGSLTPEEVDRAIQQVLDSTTIKQQISAHQHRGIFDAVDAIQSLLIEDSTRRQEARLSGSRPDP